MGNPFKITTPVGAGLQRDPSTGRLMSGTTDETPALAAPRITRQAAEQGVEVTEMIKRNPAPTGPAAIQRAGFVRPGLPFRVS